MSQDDPFGLNDPERTRIARPQPGGRGPAMPAAPQPPRPGSGAPLPEGTSGRGPRVQAAFGLLMLAPRLRSRLPPS
ncbi:MAG: type VI secretion system protein TssL, partial [Geminicoccaceae bacterium]